MTTATTHRTDLNALSLEISATMYHALQRLEQYRAYRRTVSELRNLNSAQLADLGLHRSGIRAVARQVVYGV